MEMLNHVDHHLGRNFKGFMKIILMLFHAFILNGCIEEDFDTPIFSQKIGDCSKNMRSTSKYQKLVLFDDFIPNHSDPCYHNLEKLTCRIRPDWGKSSRECPASINKNRYRDLNKCLWTAYTGWNFWEKNWNNKQQENLSAFEDEAFDIKDGYLILKVLRNPNYNAKEDNCGKETPSGSYFEYGSHCPISVAGIDSKYFDEITPGHNMKYGRLEIKAKTVRKGNFDPLYSAFWLWPNDRGTGKPYLSNSQNFAESHQGNGYADFAEIDILEHNTPLKTGYQSYVNWTTNGAAVTAKNYGFTMEQERIYGVEWNKDSIVWYINDCKVAEIQKNQISETGLKLPLKINDIPSFIILYSNLGTGFTAKDQNLHINSEFLIDYVALYEE
jgi:hypothetical protein